MKRPFWLDENVSGDSWNRDPVHLEAVKELQVPTNKTRKQQLQLSVAGSKMYNKTLDNLPHGNQRDFVLRVPSVRPTIPFDFLGNMWDLKKDLATIFYAQVIRGDLGVLSTFRLKRQVVIVKMRAFYLTGGSECAPKLEPWRVVGAPWFIM